MNFSISGISHSVSTAVLNQYNALPTLGRFTWAALGTTAAGVLTNSPKLKAIGIFLCSIDVIHLGLSSRQQSAEKTRLAARAQVDAPSAPAAERVASSVLEAQVASQQLPSAKLRPAFDYKNLVLEADALLQEFKA